MEKERGAWLKSLPLSDKENAGKVQSSCDWIVIMLRKKMGKA